MASETFAFGILLVAAALIAIRTAVHSIVAAQHLRGARVVTCPETGRPAAVRLNRLHAALTAFANHKPELQLTDCSRWPERGPCSQPCAPEAASPDSAATKIVARWAAGKRCVSCGGSLLEAPFTGRHVALFGPDGVTTEWTDVPPEALLDMLPRHRPLCWNCHVAADFRRKRPDLVTDRSPGPVAH